jgi:hypothetical protein
MFVPIPEAFHHHLCATLVFVSWPSWQPDSDLAQVVVPQPLMQVQVLVPLAQVAQQVTSPRLVRLPQYGHAYLVDSHALS